MLRKVYDSLLALAYPQGCLSCKHSVEKSSNGVACENCWRKTRTFLHSETICHKCGKLHGGKPSGFETFCRECDTHFYDQARSAGVYEFALAATILNLKKETRLPKRATDAILQAYAKTDFTEADLIVPIPLSKHRLLERGFNQAAIIARLISKDIEKPIEENILIRTKHSKIHRAGMDRRGRELSVEKSFEFTGDISLDEKTILLVDDVFASGATVSACAKILKKNGASKVNVFTMARAA